MKNNKHDNLTRKNASERPVAISNKLKKQKHRLFKIIAASLFALCMAMFIFSARFSAYPPIINNGVLSS